MHKIQRMSKFFKYFFLLCMIGLPILLLFFWIYIHQPIIQGNPLSINFLPEGYPVPKYLSFNTKVLGFLFGLLPTTVMLIVFYYLVKFFSLLEKGIIFSLQTVLYIRYIAIVLLVGQFVISPVYQSLITALLSWQRGPDHRSLEISISNQNVGLIIIALIMFVASWIMAEGLTLKQDQELTI